MVDVVYSGPSHELDLTNTDDDRFVQRATAHSIRPQRAHDTTMITRLFRDLSFDIIARHHHCHITICMEIRRDHMHERCIRPRKVYDARPRRCWYGWPDLHVIFLVVDGYLFGRRGAPASTQSVRTRSLELPRCTRANLSDPPNPQR